MARSISMVTSQFFNGYVAGPGTYVPAHNKNGKPISARFSVDVMFNSQPKANDGQGRTDAFRFTAWGKLADIMARSCSVGKGLDLVATPQSYVGTLFNADGSPRLDNAGQAIKISKIGFTIDNVIFGAESAKMIQEEIARGVRPADWNYIGPDPARAAQRELWQSRLAARKAMEWDGVSPTFGFARVVVPTGPGISLAGQAPTEYTAQAVNTEQAVAAVANSMAPPAVPAPVQMSNSIF